MKKLPLNFSKVEYFRLLNIKRMEYYVCLFIDSFELEDIGSFLSEIEACAQAGENINVVKTLGYCGDIPYGTRTLGLVMECVTMVVDGQEISGLMMYLMYLRKLFKRC